MRHANAGRKLGRRTGPRKALLRGLVTALFTYGRIRTTLARARETRPLAEKFITLAKKGDLHSRRQVLAYVYDKEIVKRLFEEIAVWYEKRQGGYTRILKLDPRPGDKSLMAFLELVDKKELGIIKKVVLPKKKFKKIKAGKNAKEIKPEAKKVKKKAVKKVTKK
jgi:large subunit ribosomal protein L17